MEVTATVLATITAVLIVLAAVWQGMTISFESVVKAGLKGKEIPTFFPFGKEVEGVTSEQRTEMKREVLGWLLVLCAGVTGYGASWALGLSSVSNSGRPDSLITPKDVVSLANLVGLLITSVLALQIFCYFNKASRKP